MLQDAGYHLAIITNQSGIARGLYTEADMKRLHEYMKEQLAEQGVHIAAVAFCPHDRDSTCDCRKPNIGMAKQIEDKIGAIDYAASWTIGDKPADLGFGKNAGTRTALLTSRFWNAEDLPVAPTLIAEGLYEAAQKIVTI